MYLPDLRRRRGKFTKVPTGLTVPEALSSAPGRTLASRFLSTAFFVPPLKMPARNVACSPALALKLQRARLTGCAFLRLPNAATGETTAFVCFHFTGFP